MVFGIHKDGKCYYNAEMLDAFNYAQENYANFSEALSKRVSNAQQI